jgi:hypothetical protein
LDDKHYIYINIAKIGSAYFVFVFTFNATKEALGSSYKKPTLESFYDALTREKDNILQLGVINTIGTSKKALVSQQKYKSKNPKKKHPRHNNKQNKGPKPTQPTFAPDGDKGEKTKIKKIGDRHCSFFRKDGHVESKFF